MDYYKVIFSLDKPTSWQVDLFKDSLLQAGFDSFVDFDKGFEAYAPKKDFKPETIQSVIDSSFLENPQKVSFVTEFIEDRDWNSVWEADSPSVRIDNRCLIRKSTQEKQDTLYDIVINPRQSFGTATHPTTYMMIETLLSLNLKSKDVMDMGCGTGVLAILAKKMGADYVQAIDIDSWAYENVKDNAKCNKVDIDILLGGSEVLKNEKKFDVFLANINLNILLDNLDFYMPCVKDKGLLILSGFYQEDILEIEHKTKGRGFTLLSKKVRDSWACVVLEKTPDKLQ